MEKSKLKLLVEAGMPSWEDHHEKTKFGGKAGWWLKQNILGNAGVENSEAAFDYTYPQLFGQFPKRRKSDKNPPPSPALGIWDSVDRNVPLLCIADESAAVRLGVGSVATWHGHIDVRDGRVVGCTYPPQSVMGKPNLLPLVIRETANLLEAAKNPSILKHPTVVKGASPFVESASEMTFDLEWRYEKAVKAKKATKKNAAVEAKAAVSGEINVVGVAYESGKSYSTYDVGDGVATVSEALRRGIRLIGHNIINADLPKIAEYTGIVPKSFGPDHIIDTMIVAHLIHPHWSELGLFGLSDLTRYYFPVTEWKHQKGDALEYNGRDTAYNHRLWKSLEIDLGITDQWHLVEKDQRLAQMANLMRIRGMRIDSDGLRVFKLAWAKRRTDIKESLPFNPQSPKQVKEWFDPWKYRLQKTAYDSLVRMLRSKSKYARDMTRIAADGSMMLVEGFDVAELNEPQRVMLDLILFKDEGKGVQSWFDEVAIERGRIHPKFNVTGTSVARFSSSEPNAQNIPPEYRRFILAQNDDEELWSFDGKNIEGRTVARQANAKTMLADFASGADVHRKTAANILSSIRGYRLQESDVTDAERQAGKMTVHASNYVETVPSLAGRLYGNATDESKRKAQQFQDGYFAAYPEIREWHDRLRHQMSQGDITIVNSFGRVRSIYDVNDHERTKRAAHFLGCSDGADVVNQRALDVWDETGQIPQSIVHDELLYSLPKGHEGQRIGIEIREILNSPIKQLGGFVIPFDLKRGLNYGKYKAGKNEDGFKEIK